MNTATKEEISLTTTLVSINGWRILHLPRSISDKLPSRGQVMVCLKVNDVEFDTPLEPDGAWGHWLRLDGSMLEKIGAKAGDSVNVTISPIKTWSEPTIPADLQTALKKHDKAHALWQTVTPLAHWEWVRWIRSTASDETRQKRIDVAMSKLANGTRRPCCWNRNLSTEPRVSKSGILLEPES